MNTPTKILHIDPDFKITYFFKHEEGLSHSLVSINEAIRLLKTVEFDLILSEPHNKAILKEVPMPETKGD
jgi:hypothetical protein